MARPTARSDAASSATSPASSTGPSNQDLTTNRSVLVSKVRSLQRTQSISTRRCWWCSTRGSSPSHAVTRSPLAVDDQVDPSAGGRVEPGRSSGGSEPVGQMLHYLGDRLATYERRSRRPGRPGGQGAASTNGTRFPKTAFTVNTKAGSVSRPGGYTTTDARPTRTTSTGRPPCSCSPPRYAPPVRARAVHQRQNGPHDRRGSSSRPHRGGPRAQTEPDAKALLRRRPR